MMKLQGGGDKIILKGRDGNEKVKEVQEEKEKPQNHTMTDESASNAISTSLDAAKAHTHEFNTKNIDTTESNSTEMTSNKNDKLHQTALHYIRRW